MDKATHRIGRLQIDVQAENPARAFALRQQLRDDWKPLLDELQHDFDGMAHAGQWMHIPRLEFHIAVENTNDLEQRLLPLLRQAIADRGALALTPGEVRSVRAAPSAPDRHPDSKVAGDESPAPAGEIVAKTAQGRSISVIEVLEFYLQNGRLPWFASAISDWRDRFEVLIKQDFAKLVMATVVCESAYPCLRLLGLIPDSLLQASIPQLAVAANLEDRTQWLLQTLALVESPTITSRHQRNWILARVMFSLVRSGTGRPEQAVPPESGWLLPREYRLSEPAWYGLLERAGHEAGQILSLEDILPADTVSGIKPDGGMKTETGGIFDKPATETDDTDEGRSQSPSEKGGDALPVSNAGLILLHPYIPRYLKACGINMSSPGPTRADYDLAAALLYHLVAADEQPQEYQLGVVKLMLGLSPEYPLPIAGDLLNDDSKLEAEQVLSSCISHWTALKATSPDGLRRGFLQRPGLLRDLDKHWELTIERTGLDVLLDQLPYAYSIVKLPWMPKSILIEW
jgi:hypothetical protein